MACWQAIFFLFSLSTWRPSSLQLPCRLTCDPLTKTLVNEETMIQYVQEIIPPYIENVRKDIFDNKCALWSSIISKVKSLMKWIRDCCKATNYFHLQNWEASLLSLLQTLCSYCYGFMRNLQLSLPFQMLIGRQFICTQAALTFLRLSSVHILLENGNSTTRSSTNDTESVQQQKGRLTRC